MGAFPIRHPDLSVNNLFVNDDLHITCSIDWGFASSVPFAELLAVPGMSYPRGSAGPSLVAAFRVGFEEKGGRIEPHGLGEDMALPAIGIQGFLAGLSSLRRVLQVGLSRSACQLCGPSSTAVLPAVKFGGILLP